MDRRRQQKLCLGVYPFPNDQPNEAQMIKIAKYAYEQCNSLIYNSDFMRIKKREREKCLITLFSIIHTDRIIPLVIFYSPVGRHSNLIAGQEITIWYNLVSVSI